MWLLLACQQPCPPEMALIGASHPDAFCIDRFEGILLSPKGLPITPNNGIPAGSALRAKVGQIPTTGVSFQEALAICNATPAQIDGKTYAQKYLPTREQWLDAADGTLGSGGRTYPYGNKYQPNYCNIPENTSIPPAQHSLAPSGSFLSCRTTEGLFDMAGNVFEWVNPGLTVDTQQTLSHLAGMELVLTIDPQGWVRAPETTDLRQLDSEATSIDRTTLRRDAQGGLWMHWQGSVENPIGFLVLHNEDLSTPQTMLPVQFKTTAGQPEAQIHSYPDLDGSPVTEKIGGSYYKNGRWPNPKRNHTARFRGTIGFRCAAPPGL